LKTLGIEKLEYSSMMVQIKWNERNSMVLRLPTMSIEVDVAKAVDLVQAQIAAYIVVYVVSADYGCQLRLPSENASRFNNIIKFKKIMSFYNNNDWEAFATYFLLVSLKSTLLPPLAGLAGNHQLWPNTGIRAKKFKCNYAP
jgi:hypothetical protein